MLVKKLKVIDEAGMHARPVSKITKTAAEFDGDFNMLYNDKKVNAKSLMMIMSLGIKCGDEFSFEMNGTDEEAFWQKLQAVLSEEKVAEEV